MTIACATRPKQVSSSVFRQLSTRIVAEHLPDPVGAMPSAALAQCSTPTVASLSCAAPSTLARETRLLSWLDCLNFNGLSVVVSRPQFANDEASAYRAIEYFTHVPDDVCRKRETQMCADQLRVNFEFNFVVLHWLRFSFGVCSLLST